VKPLASLLTAAVIAFGGFGLAGCGGKERNDKGPGIVGEKTPQPTTGSHGTQSPTPSRTSTAG
jgi:hypothetical protein